MTRAGIGELTDTQLPVMCHPGISIRRQRETARIQFCVDSTTPSRGRSSTADPDLALERLYAATAAVSAAIDDEPRLLATVAEQFASLVGARYGALGILGDDGTLKGFYTHGLTNDEEQFLRPTPPVGHGILGAMLVEGRPLRIDDIDVASAGIELQKAPKRFLRVTRPVEVREGEGRTLKWARLEPYNSFKLAFEIDFDHPAVDQTGQRVEFDFASGQYKRDIARARTFGFTKDVENMRARGLGLGASMDNAIVVDDHRVLNADGLRYDDEFVKHKILDAIGDLYVAGHMLLASYTAYKSGHAMNNQLLRTLLAQKDAWEIVTFEDNRSAPRGLSELAPAW